MLFNSGSLLFNAYLNVVQEQDSTDRPDAVVDAHAATLAAASKAATEPHTVQLQSSGTYGFESWKDPAPQTLWVGGLPPPKPPRGVEGAAASQPGGSGGAGTLQGARNIIEYQPKDSYVCTRATHRANNKQKTGNNKELVAPNSLALDCNVL